MATTALPARLSCGWRVARLTRRRVETPTAQTLVFSVPGWPGHLAGQHVDLRLTAADGYRAERSYSLAAPPRDDEVSITVQRIPDGEVSDYLTDDYAVGDPLEMRGPLGDWFTWRPTDTAPVLLVAGGSGIVPLMAMIRARRAAGSTVPFRLIYSVRAPGERYYDAELRDPEPGVDVTVLYTRGAPPDWPRPPGRVTLADIASHGWPPGFEPSCFVCGPTGFVEAAADILVALGHDPARVKTERFGPGGG